MRLLVPLVFVLLAACGGEPTFDERYDGAEQQIRQKNDELEKDLDQTRPAEADEKAAPAAAKP
jgi:hypothetical protein